MIIDHDTKQVEDIGGSRRPAVILRAGEVLRRTGLSRATMYRLIARKQFPRQHRLSAGTVGWNEEEIEAWIDQRLQDALLPVDPSL